MLHLPDLIKDLGVILVTAAVVSLLFKFLKQPVVLGYLIAGLLLGPHVPFIPSVTDTESIKVWAEIGVIFLLFGLGLEFSFKKLAKVGGSASITAFFEVFFMLGVGFLTGKLFGWSDMDSLFLGGILSISSTTIIVRAFEELNLKGRNFVSLVFGVLIVEDLVAILLLVLLSTVAVTKALSGSELIESSMKLLFFMSLWFLVGIYALPAILNKIKKFLNDETMLIVSIGLCLMMVLIATKTGFSPALGAFVMGSLLAETREGKRIEHLLLPVRDLFAAVFFVSVGMLIDPEILISQFRIVLILTIVTIVGKFISSGLGALISGRSLKHSIQAGLSLAQIGEFSFIIATLGVSLKVTSDFLYPIAVAVSAVTTFTTPYQIKYSDKFYNWLEKKLPAGLKDLLSRYEAVVAQSSGQSLLGLIWQEYGMKVVLNSVLVVGIGLAAHQLATPLLIEKLGNKDWISALSCLLTLVLSAPFLWAIVLGAPAHTQDYDASVLQKLRRLQFGLSLLRAMIGMALITFIVLQFSSLEAIYGVVIVVGFMTLLFFSRLSEPIYRMIETRFVSNLNDKEKEEISKTRSVPELTPWNATLAEFILSPSSDLVAQSLLECQLKEKYGLTVALIKRGNKTLLTPGRDELLLPFDRLYLIGTDEQLALARPTIEKSDQDDPALPEEFGLESLVLSKNSQFIEKSIRDCGLRDAVNGLIVGLERNAKRTLSPDSSLILKDGDLVWIVGDRSKISAIKSNR